MGTLCKNLRALRGFLPLFTSNPIRIPIHQKSTLFTLPPSSTSKLQLQLQLPLVYNCRWLTSRPPKGVHQDDEASDSDSDNENEDAILPLAYSHRGESEFWRRKMRTLHNILDVNKDGVISFDDFILLTDRFTHLAHMTEKHNSEFRKLMQEVWEEQYGAVDPYNLVTTQQFLEEMHHALNDLQLRKKIHKFLPYLFKAVNKDRSGEITVEEFKLFFRCLGLNNEDAVVSFHAIDENDDGRLSMKEFVQLGKDFFLSEDEKRTSKLFWGPLQK